MAKTLIENMVKPFEPSLYHDEYQERLRELIERKIAGKEIVASKNDTEESNVIDLMEALKASVEQQSNVPKKKTPRRKSSKGA